MQTFSFWKRTSSWHGLDPLVLLVKKTIVFLFYHLKLTTCQEFDKIKSLLMHRYTCWLSCKSLQPMVTHNTPLCVDLQEHLHVCGDLGLQS